MVTMPAMQGSAGVWLALCRTGTAATAWVGNTVQEVLGGGGGQVPAPAAPGLQDAEKAAEITAVSATSEGSAAEPHGSAVGKEHVSEDERRQCSYRMLHYASESMGFAWCARAPYK